MLVAQPKMLFAESVDYRFFSWDALLAFLPGKGTLLLARMLMCYMDTEFKESPTWQAYMQEQETSDRA